MQLHQHPLYTVTKTQRENFDILLTAHLSMILATDQFNAQILLL
jgi:hypothetical protein